MIYDVPPADHPIDQGDLIEAVLQELASDSIADIDRAAVRVYRRRVVVLTPACDLVNIKTTTANVAEVIAAQQLVEHGLFKPADIRGPLRSGRVWGWYFLPADPSIGLNEMAVDLRRLHTVRLDILRELCRNGARPARIKPLYREHLNKHFADTFSRIGLPKPYETM